jgi:hypothetical protein
MSRFVQNLVKRWTLAFFAKHLRHCRNRKEPEVGADGFERIEFASADQTVLRGWIYRTSARDCSNGTVILTHGTADNSASLMWEARELSETFGLAAMSFDHRMHGLSGDNVPSFGAMEALEIQAAMDYGDSVGLPGPYILHGVSLGAMAAQRAGFVDRRVRGLFLEACPGWPWHAITEVVRGVNALARLAGGVVNNYYGRDVLSDGDIRRLQQPIGHDPFVCSVMGTRDRFGVEQTREVWAHWRGVGAENQFPADTPTAQKWFWAIPDAVHPGAPGKQIWDWEGSSRLRREFYARVLADESGSLIARHQELGRRL